MNLDPSLSGEKRKDQLHELDELRLQAYENAKMYKVRKWLDLKIQKREFFPGDLVLLYNSRLKFFPGKLKSKWSGPFKVIEVSPHGAVTVSDLNDTRSFKVNSHRLKKYFGQETELDTLKCDKVSMYFDD